APSERRGGVVVAVRLPVPAAASSSVSATTCWLAEKVRAETPLTSDSSRTTAPRKSGQRRRRRPPHTGRQASSLITMAPSGRRHTTVNEDGERIITPSMTAWPPTSGRRVAACSLTRGPSALLAGAAAVLLVEPLDAAGAVEQLLLAGVVGVAVGADVDAEIAARREGVVHHPAGAGDLRRAVVRMVGGRLHDEPYLVRWTRLYSRSPLADPSRGGSGLPSGNHSFFSSQTPRKRLASSSLSFLHGLSPIGTRPSSLRRRSPVRPPTVTVAIASGLRSPKSTERSHSGSPRPSQRYRRGSSGGATEVPPTIQ